jgi:hypothetical protein
MTKTPLSIIAAGLIFLLSACSDNIVETGENQPVNTTAKLNVLVRDEANGNLLVGATVKLLSTGESKTTNASGTVSFKNVGAGSHQVLIEKAGYASMLQNASIKGNTNNQANNPTDLTGVYVAQEAFNDFGLHALVGKLEGTLYYQDEEKATKIAAKGAIVRVVLDNSGFINQYIQDTVNAEGKYSFDNLPINATFDVYSLEYLAGNGISYNPQVIYTVSLNDRRTEYKNISTLVFEYANSNFIFLGCTNPDTDVTPIVCSFSEEIDKKFTNIDAIAIEFGGSTVAVKKEWVGSTLELTPMGKWESAGSELIINNAKEIRSVKGNTILSASINQKIQLPVRDISKELVTGVAFQVNTTTSIYDKVDYNETAINLRWNRVVGADGYKVYAKAVASEKYKDTWLEIAKFTDEKDTKNTINLDEDEFDIKDREGIYELYGFETKPFFAEGDSVYFVVQAYNKKYETSLENAIKAPFAVGDNVSPQLANNALVATDITVNEPKINWFLANFADIDDILGDLDADDFSTNYFLESKLGSTAAAPAFATACYVFSEPMDVDAELTGTDMERIAITPYWRDEATLCLTVGIEAGVAVTAYDKVYQLSGLKDKAGNDYEFLVCENGNENTACVGITEKRQYIDPITGALKKNETIGTLNIRFAIGL